MKSAIVSLVVAFATSAGSDAAPPPEEWVMKLTAVIREYCPDAQVEVTEEAFTAKQGTMMFTLHNRSKSGEISPKTYELEGPNFKGFMLRVSLETGKYEGAAVIPQTLQGPYFPTFIDGAATEDGRNHYRVSFSYGSRLDEKVKNAILEGIPRTKFP